MIKVKAVPEDITVPIATVNIAAANNLALFGYKILNIQVLKFQGILQGFRKVIFVNDRVSKAREWPKNISSYWAANIFELKNWQFIVPFPNIDTLNNKCPCKNS